MDIKILKVTGILHMMHGVEDYTTLEYAVCARSSAFY